jgi:hypothetical protein
VSSPDRSCLEFGHIVCHLVDQVNWQERIVIGQDDPAWQIDALVKTYLINKVDTGGSVVVEGTSKPRVFVLTDHILTILERIV